MNASPGAAVGQAYFDADLAEKMAKEQKQDVIMVRPFTKPDDVHGMIAAKGVLTSEGGATSHAAVVARQFGIPCIVGASMIKIDLEKRIMVVGETTVKEGEWISVDGTTGNVYIGKISMSAPSLEEQTDLMTLLNWADEICSRPNMRIARKAGRLPVCRYGRMQIIRKMPARPLVRRDGYWPMPNRAYVLRARTAADRPADDPGGNECRAYECIERTSTIPAEGF